MITKQQMSEVKEYLRYMIMQEAVEQIEDKYDQIELNENNVDWIARLLGGKPQVDTRLIDPATGKPFESGQSLGNSGLIDPSTGLPFARVAADAAAAAIQKGSEATTPPKEGSPPPVSGDPSQNEAIEVKRREKSISFQNLETHLREINRHYNNLVGRDGQLISGWRDHASVPGLIDQLNVFHATEKHDSSRFAKLQEAGINSPAVFSGLFHHYDETGNLSTIIEHAADRNVKFPKTSTGRNARLIMRFTNGTDQGQSGIPHPYRINGTHLYGKDTTTHETQHLSRLQDFNTQHGSYISSVLRTLRSL